MRLEVGLELDARFAVDRLSAALSEVSAAVESLRASPAVSDFEDVPVTLEEVYAALMSRPADGGAGGATSGRSTE